MPLKMRRSIQGGERHVRASASRIAILRICQPLYYVDCVLIVDRHESIRSARKPWVKGDVPISPKFVVAGSWHEMEAGKPFNIATVFDGHGKVLLRHKKRYAYTDPDGRSEKIDFGNEFAILVLDDALVAFRI